MLFSKHQYHCLHFQEICKFGCKGKEVKISPLKISRISDIGIPEAVVRSDINWLPVISAGGVAVSRSCRGVTVFCCGRGVSSVPKRIESVYIVKFIIGLPVRSGQYRVVTDGQRAENIGSKVIDVNLNSGLFLLPPIPVI